MATNGDDMGRWADDGGAPGPEPLTEAERFFLAHGGYSVGPGETVRDGQLRSARESAEAERWGASHGLVFDWEDDTDADTSCDCGADHGPAYGCVVRKDGDVVASLGGITFGEYNGPGRDPYARVVEAELAGEVMYVAEANDAMLAASPEMRALARYTEVA